MEYNKDAFLAGLSVGRRLKGWSGGKGSGGGTDGTGIIFDPSPLFSFTGKALDITPVVYGEFKEA